MQAKLSKDATGGLLLIGAAIVALIWDNSAFAPYYDALLSAVGVIAIGDYGLSKPLLLWINEGLMAIFFLLVGLEVKKEIQSGTLSDPKNISLPLLAALGGMLVPAAFYVLPNAGDPVAMAGWAVPTATDIAFAIGILALLASKAPASLKIFILTVAIIDDLGAVIVIAAFYTSDLSTLSLSLALAGCVGLFMLNRFGVRNTSAYLFVGTFIWICVLKSGVHATLAGVAVGLAIPSTKDQEGHSPLEDLEHNLHYPVTFVILPLFALANAGVALGGIGLHDIVQPISMGVLAGLVIGKPIGVIGGALLAAVAFKAKLPEGLTMRHIWGAGHLTGIGFTMSLFIGSLAFEGGSELSQVRIAILLASLLSIILGWLVLRGAPEAGFVSKPASN